MYGPEPEWTGVKVTPGGTIKVKAANREQAKAVISELKQMKKELAQAKREFTQDAKEIRSAYSAKVAGRSNMMPGGGNVGGFVRTAQKANREVQRQEKEDALAEVNAKKMYADQKMTEVDRHVLALDSLAKSK